MCKRSAWLACGVVAGLLLAIPPPGGCSTPSPALRVLVPAYFYPGGAGREEWSRLIASAPQVPIVAIVNPATGPGKQADPNYREVIDRAIAAGVKVIGYVNTDYGRRPRAEVEADVRLWIRLYPKLQGIFFDLQPSSAEHVDYYTALRKFVRQRLPRSLVVTNPGTVCVEEYLSRGAADVVCLFENREGFEQFQSPAWVARYAPPRFAALAYRVAEPERMRQYIQRAVESGLGYVYITDADGANPWDRLPAYWQEEVDTVRRLTPNIWSAIEELAATAQRGDCFVVPQKGKIRKLEPR